MELSIIIVSYNTKDLLLRCLRSIEEAAQGHSWPRGHEVLVVDNDSSDGSAEAVRRLYPEVELLENESNVGFACANNQAISRAAGDFVLLLNPDTEVRGDALGILLRFLVATPRAGMVTAKLLNPDGSLQHCAFRFPDLAQTFFDLFPIHPRLYESPLNGRYPSWAYRRAFAIDHPLGACMMVPRRVIDEVGMLSEDYFMYGEEIDWCIRMRRAGWQVYCQPAAEVVHYGGRSTRQHPRAMWVELHRSRLRLFERHYSASFRRAHRMLLGLGLRYRLRQVERAKGVGAISQEKCEEQERAIRDVLALLDGHA